VNQPKVYTIPDDAKFYPCRDRRCGQQIAFVVTETGKKMPVNPDGTPHWMNCPGAKAFKRQL
jgi:hypothetical protein